MKRSRRLALPALALSGMVLAACATIQITQGWRPRAAAEPQATVSDTTVRVEASGAGLDPRLLYRADPGAGVGARWAELPGNDGFNGELRGQVKSAIDAQAAATGVPYRPAADAPADNPATRACTPGASTRPAAELLADPALTPQTGGPTVTAVCEIVVASGSVLGEALRIVTAAGGQPQSDTTTVYYADASGAFLTTKDAIVTEDGFRQLLPRVVQSLKVAAGALEPEMKEDPAAYPPEQLRAWFSNWWFGPDGSLVVQLPDDFTTPELAQLPDVPDLSPMFVTVPAKETTALLTSEGARVQAGLASGTPLALPAGAPRGKQNIDCALFACVALTFDDGPGRYTPEVLDTLSAHRSAATFFVQGAAVSGHADLVIRMRDEGHQVANHSWNHPDLTKLSAPDVASQISRANAAIRSVTGATPTMFRPPYGAYNNTVLGAAGLPAILWSLDTNDWREPGDAVLLDRVVGRAQPGDIVLLHDVHQTTTRMTGPILDGLLNRGFTMVTVEQILGRVPAAGTATKR